MTRSLLLQRTAPRIVEEDGSFRTKMLEIASGLDDVIALGRGDPDFHTPGHIVEAAKTALDENQHHYTSPNGLPQLRQAICDNLKGEYGLDYDADEVIVTAGVHVVHAGSGAGRRRSTDHIAAFHHL